MRAAGVCSMLGGGVARRVKTCRSDSVKVLYAQQHRWASTANNEGASYMCTLGILALS